MAGTGGTTTYSPISLLTGTTLLAPKTTTTTAPKTTTVISQPTQGGGLTTTTTKPSTTMSQPTQGGGYTSTSMMDGSPATTSTRTTSTMSQPTQGGGYTSSGSPATTTSRTSTASKTASQPTQGGGIASAATSSRTPRSSASAEPSAKQAMNSLAGIDKAAQNMPTQAKAQIAAAFQQALAAAAKEGKAVPNPAGLTSEEADKYRSQFYSQFYSAQPVQQIVDDQGLGYTVNKNIDPALLAYLNRAQPAAPAPTPAFINTVPANMGIGFGQTPVAGMPGVTQGVRPALPAAGMPAAPFIPQAVRPGTPGALPANSFGMTAVGGERGLPSVLPSQVQTGGYNLGQLNSRGIADYILKTMTPDRATSQSAGGFDPLSILIGQAKGDEYVPNQVVPQGNSAAVPDKNAFFDSPPGMDPSNLYKGIIAAQQAAKDSGLYLTPYPGAASYTPGANFVNAVTAAADKGGVYSPMEDALIARGIKPGIPMAEQTGAETVRLPTPRPELTGVINMPFNELQAAVNKKAGIFAPSTEKLLAQIDTALGTAGQYDPATGRMTIPEPYAPAAQGLQARLDTNPAAKAFMQPYIDAGKLVVSPVAEPRYATVERPPETADAGLYLSPYPGASVYAPLSTLPEVPALATRSVKTVPVGGSGIPGDTSGGTAVFDAATGTKPSLTLAQEVAARNNVPVDNSKRLPGAVALDVLQSLGVDQVDPDIAAARRMGYYPSASTITATAVPKTTTAEPLPIETAEPVSVAPGPTAKTVTVQTPSGTTTAKKYTPAAGQVVGTNGYIYEVGGDGAFTRVGKVPGYTDAELYKAANAGAFRDPNNIPVGGSKTVAKAPAKKKSGKTIFDKLGDRVIEKFNDSLFHKLFLENNDTAPWGEYSRKLASNLYAPQMTTYSSTDRNWSPSMMEGSPATTSTRSSTSTTSGTRHRGDKTGGTGTGTGGTTGSGTYTPPTQALIDAMYAPYFRNAVFPPTPPFDPGVSNEWNYFPTYAQGGAVNEPRLVLGHGGPTADKIPATIDGVQEARLSNGEFVMTAAAVKNAGDGDMQKGAERLMHLNEMLSYGRPASKLNVEKVKGKAR